MKLTSLVLTGGASSHAAVCNPVVDMQDNNRQYEGLFLQGGVNDYDKCVYFIDRAETWANAAQSCQNIVPMHDGCSNPVYCRGMLASIHSQSQEQKIEQSNLRQEETYWIGLRNHCLNCEFDWADLSPIDYTNWGDGEPNNAGDGEDCVTKGDHWSSYTWNDDNCSKPYRFMCEAYTSEIHPAPDPWESASGGCKTGWTKFGNGCFKSFGGKQMNGEDAHWKNLADAKAACVAAWPGSTLAVFHNHYYQYFATSQLHELGVTTWIGAEKTSNQDHYFHWMDGSKMSFTNWAPGEPNGELSGENGVEMYAKTNYEFGSKAGSWNDIWVDHHKAYMCSHVVDPMESGTGPNPLNCPDGWTPYRHFCYKLEGAQESGHKSFDDANADCMAQDKRAKLASIIDDHEFNFIRSMFYKTLDLNKGTINTPGPWIGLEIRQDKDGAVNGKWLDGFLYQVDYWGSKQPDGNIIPKDGSRACAFMEVPTGFWKIADQDCKQRYPYVCKLNIEDLDFNPDHWEDKRGEPLDCPTGWTALVSDEHVCVRAGTDSFNWFEAEGKCSHWHYGTGHLVSIHSETKNTEVKALYQSLSDKDFWVGARRNPNNAFVWTDNTEFLYTKWSQGEPSGEWQGVAEDCVHLRNDGYWNDAYCADDYMGYVCQISRMYSNCVSTPEADKEICPDGHDERSCNLLKCCWDPTAKKKCYMPGLGKSSDGMSPGAAAGIVSGVFIALNFALFAFFTLRN